ncbi:MAG: hypothetical protein COY81_03570 [Candidatus Pacebacteria bacterium CG_4_10_14_0_8_um_filter_43_12]|nr:MAG: hypothetical protein COY81_03570 [Candidatus Pacebacteria bacterium CG_4_10_14_0_8_um_filter_43_12]
MKKKLTICFFGTYDREYTSNKLVLHGLQENGAIIHEVNAHIPVTRLDKQSEMSWATILKRIWNKHKIISVIARNWPEIAESDVIYVGYPGHFDVFFAYVVAKILGKRLIFNPLLIIYVGFSEEQRILSKSSMLGKAIKFFEGLAYQACDLVFADTPFQEEFLKNIFGVPQAKLKVLAIGADDRYYRFTPYVNKSNKINVVYYGLYSPIHGVEYIIDAANKLKRNSNIHFTMVGNGNTFDKNYKKSQKLNLKNITFFYDVPLSSHPAIIEKADIFLGFLGDSPTVKRVIPNKVYQGLALNKIVITADAPVTRSLFKHKENMYLIPPANTEKLVDALIELQNNPTLRMNIARNGYSLFSKNFSPKAVGKQLLENIATLIEGEKK